MRGGYRALDAMEGHLADHEFLVGERYTIADISLYAYTHVAHEGGFDLDGYPAIRAWLDRVVAQPGHAPITA
jgi:glutathione S-transferase